MADQTIGELPGGGAPWGGIVKAETPFTDRVTTQLLAQQQERRQYQQQTTLQADEQMNKELANVRSADMPDVMNSYGQWKNISMQMLSPKVQGDPKAYNELQVQKNAALGQTMAAINRSAQLNSQAKEMVAERKLKPNLYSDDFGDRIVAFNKTPMDQLANHPQYGDLTNPDAFRYTGSQTDFGKMETAAAGKFQAVAGAEKTEKISDMQSRVTPTEFGATPAQFFDNLRGQFAQHIPGRDAAAAWEAVPEMQRAAVDQQFAAIPPEKWLAMTGQPKPQVVAPADANNPAEQYAAYRAKIYALNAAPKAGTPQNVINQQGKMQEQSQLSFNRQSAMEALKEGDREKLAGMKHQFHQMDAKDKDAAMNGVVDDMLTQAKAGGVIEYRPAAGGALRQYDIPASTILKKEFSVPDDKGHPIPVDAFRLSEDGQTVTPIFWKPGQTGNSREVNVDLSRPMTIGEFKARAAKAMFGVKESARETANPKKLAVGAFDDIQ
jgi:hypothetical protein